MSSTNYSENFCEAINIVTNSIIQGLSFDKTILCTIINIDKAQKGEYLVSDGSSTFTAVSSNKTYKVNTQVYVLIPNGDYTQQKLIVSEYVSGTENEKEDYSFPFETIVPGETIEIEEKNIGLIANKKQKKNNGYGIKIIDSTKSEYQFNKEIIYTRLGVQASFKTFFEELIENSDKTTSRKEVYIEYGDYSIVITLSGTDKDGKAIKDKRYLFNCSDFFGNPYRLDAYTEQSIVFNISEFKKITSIDVQFQESGNFYSINDQTGEKKFFKTTQNKKGEDEANLYVTDLKFIFGFDINEYETNDLLINNLEELNYKNNQKKNLQLNWIRKRTDQSSLISLYEESMLKLYCKDLWYLWNARDEDLNFPDSSNDLEKKVLENKFTNDISFYWYKYLIKSGVSDKILDEELWTLAAYYNGSNYIDSDLNQAKEITTDPFKFDFKTSVENNREKIKMAIVLNGCLRKKTLTLTEGIDIDGTTEKEVIILKKVEKPYYLSESDWNYKLRDEFDSGDNVDNNSNIKLVGENACIITNGNDQYNKYIYPYENEVYYTPDVTVDIEDIFNNKDELDMEFKEKGIKVVYYLDDEDKYINTKINLKGTEKKFILLDWVRQYNKEQIEVEATEGGSLIAKLDKNGNPKYAISTTPEFLSENEFSKEKIKDSNGEEHNIYQFDLVPIKVFKSNEIIYTNTTDSAVYNTTNLVENIELNCIDQLKGNYFIYGFDDHVGQDTASCANRKIQVKFDSINSEDVDSENVKMAWRIPKELSMIVTPEAFEIEDTDTTNFSSVLSDKKTVKWVNGDEIANKIKNAEKEENVAEAIEKVKKEYSEYWIDNKQSTYKGYWISSQIEVKNSASGKEDSTKEYNFSIPYAINDLYRSTWANNKIYCFIWKKIKGANDNQVTINMSEKELYFGHLGSNGTKYSFNIRFGCPYIIEKSDDGSYTVKSKKSDLIQPFLDSNVDTVGVEIIPTLYTGSEALTIDPKKIKWSWHIGPFFTEKRELTIDNEVQEKDIKYRTVATHKLSSGSFSGKYFIRTCNTNNCYDDLPSNYPSTDITGKDLKTSLHFYSKNHCAILKATIEYKSKKLDAYLPIPMRFDTTVGVYSGADKVIYNSLGTEPYYHDTEHMLYSKNNEPFEDSRFEVYIDRKKSSTPIDKNYYPYFETGSILTYNQKNYRLYVQPNIFDTIYGYNSSHNKKDGSGKLLQFDADLIFKTEIDVYECKSNGNTLTWYTDAGKADEDKRVGYLYTYDTNILKAPRMFYSENAKTPVSIIGFKTGTIKWGGHEYILYKNNNLNYDFDDFDGFYGYNENKIDKEKSKGTLLKFKLKDLSYSGTVSIYNVTLPTESNNYQLMGYTKENSTNSKYKIDATQKGRTTCFVQPIFIAQNRFGNTIVNEWDGKLQINEEDNYILSMMMGAGIKEKTDNSFSGVLMGEVQRSNTRTIGLFGYDHGEEAFGFKRDGTAFIGKSGTGRIEFNGTKGTITSSNYINNKTGTHLDLTNGKLISQNDGGTITIDPEKENALFHVKTSNDAGNKTLINIGTGQYYLQSADYTNDGQEGMNINLFNGRLISKNNGGIITIDPTLSRALFQVKNNNGNTLMNIGTSNYYLQSADYIQRVKGVKINLGSGGFSIASELPEDSSSAAGIVISNSGKYLQITKNITKLSEGITIRDHDDEEQGADSIFTKKVDIFVHPFGEELIFRECTTDRFYKVKMAIKQSGSEARWIPKDLAVLFNIDSTYTFTSNKDVTYTGYRYNLIIGPEIYSDLLAEAVKLRETFEEAGQAINMGSDGWSYNKNNKIITHKNQAIGDNGDTYDCQYKLAYLGDPKTNNQIAFLETDDSVLTGVPPWARNKALIGHGNSVAYSQTTKSFFVASTRGSYTYTKDDEVKKEVFDLIEYKYDTSSKKWAFGLFELEKAGAPWEIAIMKEPEDDKEYLYVIGVLNYDYLDSHRARKGDLHKYKIELDEKGETDITPVATINLSVYPMGKNINEVKNLRETMSLIGDGNVSKCFKTVNDDSIINKKGLTFDDVVSTPSYITSQVRQFLTTKLTNSKTTLTLNEIKENKTIVSFLAHLTNSNRRSKLKELCDGNNPTIDNTAYASFQGMDVYQETENSPRYVFLPIVRWANTRSKAKHYIYIKDIDTNGFVKNIEIINPDNDRWEIEETSFVEEGNDLYMYISTSALGAPYRMVKIFKILFNDYLSKLTSDDKLEIDFSKSNKVYYSHIIPQGGQRINFAQGFTVGKIDNNQVFFYVARDLSDNDNSTKVQLVADRIADAETNVLKLFKTTLLDISSNSFYLKSANYSHEDSNGVGFTGTFFDLNTGKLITSSADITGKITATSGKIGGWEITDSDLRNRTNNNNYFLLSGEGFDNYFIIAKYGGNRKFSVDINGLLYARNADIGGAITATSGTFTNCDIKSSCTIGEWKVGNSSLYYGSATFGANRAFLFPSGKSMTGPSGVTDKSWVFGAGNNFGVTTEGYLFARDVDIQGTITGSTIQTAIDASGSSIEMSKEGILKFSYDNNLYGQIKTTVDQKGTSYWTLLAELPSDWISDDGTTVKRGISFGFSREFIDPETQTTQTARYFLYPQKHYFQGPIELGTNSSFNFPNIGGFLMKLGSQIILNYQVDKDNKVTPELQFGPARDADCNLNVNIRGLNVLINGDSIQLASPYWVTSDSRVKNTITSLTDNYEKLFLKLKPVSYKFNNGTSDRTHIGFIAQEVLSAIESSNFTSKDFAAFIAEKNPEIFGFEDEGYGLRYEEFIALNTHMIQKCLKRIDELENEIKTLKAQS